MESQHERLGGRFSELADAEAYALGTLPLATEAEYGYNKTGRTLEEGERCRSALFCGAAAWRLQRLLGWQWCFPPRPVRRAESCVYNAQTRAVTATITRRLDGYADRRRRPAAVRVRADGMRSGDHDQHRLDRDLRRGGFRRANRARRVGRSLRPWVHRGSQHPRDRDLARAGRSVRHCSRHRDLRRRPVGARPERSCARPEQYRPEC